MKLLSFGVAMAGFFLCQTAGAATLSVEGAPGQCPDASKLKAGVSDRIGVDVFKEGSTPGAPPVHIIVRYTEGAESLVTVTEEASGDHVIRGPVDCAEVARQLYNYVGSLVDRPVPTSAKGWPGAAIWQFTGTTVQMGMMNGAPRPMYLPQYEEVCKLPCSAPLHVHGRYYVDGPGGRQLEFQVPAQKPRLDLNVVPGAIGPFRTGLGLITGGSILLGGGAIVAGISEGKGAAVGGASAAVVGGIVLIVGVAVLASAPPTTIVDADGKRVAKRFRLSAEGVTF